jgi:hypothetical protein
VPQSEVDAFMRAAMAHADDHLLRTVMNWVMVRWQFNPASRATERWPSDP